MRYVDEKVRAVLQAWTDTFPSNHVKDYSNSIRQYFNDICLMNDCIIKLISEHRNVFIFSTDNLTEAEALDLFKENFLESSLISDTWEETAEKFISQRGNRRTLLIISGNDVSVRQKCLNTFKKMTKIGSFFRTCEAVSDPNPLKGQDNWSGGMQLSDYFYAFPGMRRPDILRLYALTGGTYMFIRDIDENSDYDQALDMLLRYDSLYSSYLPDLLEKSFRTPESYYPILYSISKGNHRLSEIAKDTDLPYNKCGNCLEALINNGFVVPVREKDKKNTSLYYCSNTYVTSWFRYIYKNRYYQIADKEKLNKIIRDDIDDAIAMPVFLEACMRFLKKSERDYLKPFQEEKNLIVEKNIRGENSYGEGIKIDLSVSAGYTTLFCVFPESVKSTFKKKELKDIIEAVRISFPGTEKELTVFSVNRFSDWCVHYSKYDDYLHEVTLERLRY